MQGQLFLNISVITGNAYYYMKKVILLLLVIITANTAFIPGRSIISHSSVTFQVKNLGINTTGTLGGLKANIEFNPANLASALIEASVDVNSINTDNSSRDDHLKSEDFFDAAHYPTITMRSVSFKHKSGNNYIGQFNLTMKGKTKLIDIPFSCTEKNTNMEFKGVFKINRLDFGVGENSMVLSNDVTVNLDAEIVK